MQILKRIPYIASLTFLVYMPLHIFLSQSLSLVTGGLDAWKVGKDVLLILAVLFTICLVWWQGKANRVFNIAVAATFFYVLLHLLLWWSSSEIYDRSAMLGIIYNMRLPLFLILGISTVLLLSKFAISSVIKVLLIVSTTVASLGVLQYMLPSDLLTHMGYGIERGARAAFFIDDNPDLPRIMSTLREPNALGAYLILPAASLGLLLLRVQENNRRLVLAAALCLHLAAIFLTFSRSAWLAVVIAGALVVWWHYSEWLWRQAKRYWPVGVGLVLCALVAVFAMRNTYFFQHYIVHSDPNEQVTDLDSNDYHLLFAKQGLEGIWDKPLGHGPGTAGLASIQNPEGSFLTENYYIQIGYELGVLGFVLFIALNVWIYIRIMKRRGDEWAGVLVASFWAYIVTNMLLHTWSNEAVTAQWWLLAGMMLALPTKRSLKSSQRSSKSD